MPAIIEHLNAHDVTVLEEWGPWLTFEQGLHNALFRETGVANTALRDRLARPPVAAAI